MTEGQIIERVARTLLRQRGLDPDMMVQPGEPMVIQTPTCVVTKMVPEASDVLWKFYIPVAQSMLAVTREVEQEAAADKASVKAAINDLTFSTLAGTGSTAA